MPDVHKRPKAHKTPERQGGRLNYNMRSDGGIFVAEETRDEQAITAALKQIDPRLALQKEPANAVGGWKYKVLRIWSEDHPPTPILTWTDEYGNPLPLTDGIIDKVHIHMLGFRGNSYYVSADEHNAKLTERREKQHADDLAAVISEHKPRLSGRTSVSMSGKRQRTHHSASPEAPNAHERI